MKFPKNHPDNDLYKSACLPADREKNNMSLSLMASSAEAPKWSRFPLNRDAHRIARSYRPQVESHPPLDRPVSSNHNAWRKSDYVLLGALGVNADESSFLSMWINAARGNWTNLKEKRYATDRLRYLEGRGFVRHPSDLGEVLCQHGSKRLVLLQETSTTRALADIAGVSYLIHNGRLVLPQEDSAAKLQSVSIDHPSSTYGLTVAPHPFDNMGTRRFWGLSADDELKPGEPEQMETFKQYIQTSLSMRGIKWISNFGEGLFDVAAWRNVPFLEGSGQPRDSKNFGVVVTIDVG